MAQIELIDCCAVHVLASVAAISDSCTLFGVNCYLLGTNDDVTVIASSLDAQRIISCFQGVSTLLDKNIRVVKLPEGVCQLSRRRKTNSRGMVDKWEIGESVSGWYHPNHVPGLKIYLFEDDTCLAELDANIFRPDLYEAGIADGVAGFISSCPFDASRCQELTMRNIDGVILHRFSLPKTSLLSGKTSSANDKTNFLEIGDFPDVNSNGHYRAELDGFFLDYVISTGSVDKMIIFLPGFLDTRRFPYPYFQRMKWAQDLHATCVFVADPTLLIGKTQIGWFVGDQKNHYLPTVAKYIGELAQSRGIAIEDILFFGSSAGGFSAIGMATHLKGASAFAINPQTNGLKLHSPSQLDNTLRSCLDITDVTDAYNRYAERFILSEMFRLQCHIPRITIWQNFYDRYHLEYHLLPFLNEIKGMSPSHMLELHMDSRPEAGHNPPDLNLIHHLLER